MQTTISEVVRSFIADWSRHHGARQPMGWVLRSDDQVPWVRFHALPGSKRYPENGEELATILARGNSLATELLGLDSDCWIICARLDEIRGPGDFAGTWTEDCSESEGENWSYYVREDTWSAGKFDDLFADIANDVSPHTIWFNRLSGRIFAPYDGGFDLFPGSVEEVHDLKMRHVEWLSEREDGL